MTLSFRVWFVGSGSFALPVSDRFREAPAILIVALGEIVQVPVPQEAAPTTALPFFNAPFGSADAFGGTSYGPAAGPARPHLKH